MAMILDGTNGVTFNDNSVQPASGATKGANSNITSLTGLTTPLSVAQGGTGTNSARAWVDVAASRVSGTSYINNTGREISVAVQCSSNVGAVNSVQILVNGLLIMYQYLLAGAGVQTAASVFANVPAGATYSATFAGVSNTWVELR